MILMGHALPYYEKLFKAAGYKKAMDMFAYLLDITKEFDEKIQRFVAMGRRNKSIEIRDLDTKHYSQEMDLLFEIYNNAWANNWGFIPLTEEEWHHVKKDMKPIIVGHRARICSHKGEPVAFMVALPDINDVTKDFGGKPCRRQRPRCECPPTARPGSGRARG